MICTLKSFAQTYWINTNPFLDSLYLWDKQIPQITNTQYNHFLPISFNKMEDNQLIIKNKSGLYILIDGTGRVYKATNRQNNQIEFTRIDSTKHQGNNYSSFNFSYQDTIFSFGGYGFWHLNGQLRYFNPGYDWNIQKLNKEYPTFSNGAQFINQQSKVFFISSNIGNDLAFDQDIHERSLIELNLKTKKVQFIGKLTKEGYPILDETFTINCLNGIFWGHESKYYLLNFQNNKIYKLKNQSIYDAFFRNSTRIANTFETDGRIYFTALPDYKLQSIPISMNDFALESFQIYEPRNQTNYWIIGVIGLIVISVGVYFVFRKVNKSHPPIQKIQTNIEESPSNEYDFSPIEQHLIDLILSNSEKGLYVTVDQINNTLGLSKKSVEIQKKVRGESINKINHKFKIIFHSELDLIIRNRSESDRRYYNYIITKENTVLYKSKY